MLELGGDTHGRVLTMRGDRASPCTSSCTTSWSWSWSVNAVSRIHLLSRSKPSTAADVDDADSLCLLLLIHSQYRHIIIPLDRCLPAYFNCPAHCSRPPASGQHMWSQQTDNWFGCFYDSRNGAHLDSSVGHKEARCRGILTLLLQSCTCRHRPHTYTTAGTFVR